MRPVKFDYDKWQEGCVLSLGVVVRKDTAHGSTTSNLEMKGNAP